ncbi:tyrosine-type recombinase/integrase [Listeria rocourtiae]|uniref:tyrosine-type recombinase/integrase n=1 Tax=Listeria rocourtiae TaxID=647910 RepID=UPI0021AB8A48|nr:tyrosine-type recombinase/integrase [Listeria rocourtiae]
MNEVEPIKDLAKIGLMKDVLARGKFGKRNVLLFTTFINTAYRISDLISLKLSDVLEIHRKKIRVKERLIMKEQKTSKNNSVILTKKLQEEISAFVEEQYSARYVAQDLDHYLFVSRQHQPGRQPISRRQVWLVLSEAGKKQG